MAVETLGLQGCSFAANLFIFIFFDHFPFVFHLELHGNKSFISTGCWSAAASLSCSKEDCPQGSDWENAKSMHNLCGLDIDGNEVPLEKYKGYVCLIVNLASNCGKTQVNYTELVEMHNNFADKGLRILGFPCNQFGGQEPGTDAEIKEFAKGYNVKFDMFSKIDVNGDNAHPLWKWMKRHPNGAGYLVNHIKWNFTKFLIDRNGQVAKRYGPNQDPSEVEKDLADYL
ncbi:phospholipid hydroperoxide glutathione peroxidase-like isoform X2 [Stigmatopora nigra]